MHTPRSRGAYCKHEKTKSTIDFPGACDNIDYCPHCLNGGGKGAVVTALKNNFTPYRSDNRKRAGLCGDPLGNNDHMLGGKFLPFDKAPIVAGYEPGSFIDFELQMDTHHNGYAIFYLCNLDACGTKDLEQKCFDQGHCKLLERVAVPQCETNNDHDVCGPIDPKFKSRWYLPCKSENKFMGGESGTMRYKIPAGLECKHCVVQFYWVTANACNPKDYVQYFKNKPFGSTCGGDGGAVGGYNANAAACGGPTFPEEFWGCADVTVKQGASKLSVPQLQEGGPATSATANEDDDDDKNEAPEPAATTESKPTETPEPEPKATPESKPTETPEATHAEHANENHAKDTAKHEESSGLHEKKGSVATTPEPAPESTSTAEEPKHDHNHETASSEAHNHEMSPTQTPAPRAHAPIRLSAENGYEVEVSGTWYKLYCSPRFRIYVVKYNGEWRTVPGISAPEDCRIPQANLQS